MLTRIVIGLVMVVVGFATLGADIKKVAPKATSPASGQEMFLQYCAVCHGKAGKGDGPAASALKMPPADLTSLTAHNGGAFPELRVFASIRGDADRPAAHGSKDMPVWGTVFQSMGRDSGASTQMRVSNLTGYIKSLQK